MGKTRMDFMQVFEYAYRTKQGYNQALKSLYEKYPEFEFAVEENPKNRRWELETYGRYLAFQKVLKIHPEDVLEKEMKRMKPIINYMDKEDLAEYEEFYLETIEKNYLAALTQQYDYNFKEERRLDFI